MKKKSEKLLKKLSFKQRSVLCFCFCVLANVFCSILMFCLNFSFSKTIDIELTEAFVSFLLSSMFFMYHIIDSIKELKADLKLARAETDFKEHEHLNEMFLKLNRTAKDNLMSYLEILSKNGQNLTPTKKDVE